MSSTKLDKTRATSFINNAIGLRAHDVWQQVIQTFSDAKTKPSPEIMLDILSTMDILLWDIEFTRAVLDKKNYNFDSAVLAKALDSGLSAHDKTVKTPTNWLRLIDLYTIPDALNQTTKNKIARRVLETEGYDRRLTEIILRQPVHNENEEVKKDTDETRHYIITELIFRGIKEQPNIMTYLIFHKCITPAEVSKVLTTLIENKRFRGHWGEMGYLCSDKVSKEFRPNQKLTHLALRSAVDNAQDNFIRDFFRFNPQIDDTKTEKDIAEARLYAFKYLLAKKADMSFLLDKKSNLITPSERVFIEVSMAPLPAKLPEAPQQQTKELETLIKLIPTEPLKDRKYPNSEARSSETPQQRPKELETLHKPANPPTDPSDRKKAKSEATPSKTEVEACKKIIDDLAKLTKDYKESLDNDQVQIHGILDQLQKALAGGITKDTIETYYQILKNKHDGVNTNLQVIQSNKDTSTLLFIAGIAAIFATVVTGILPGLAVMGIVFLATGKTPMRFFQPQSQSFAEDTEGVKPDYLKENKGI